MIRFWKSWKSLKSSRPSATPPTAGVDEVSTEAVAVESLTLGVGAVKRGHNDLQPPPPQQQQQEKRSKGSSDEQQDQERVNDAMADIEEKITSCKKSIVDYGKSVVAMENGILAMQEEVEEIKSRIKIAEAAFAHLESLGAFLALPKNTFLRQALRVHESTEKNDDALRAFLAEQKVNLRDKEKYLEKKENRLTDEKNRLADEKTLLLRFDGDKTRLMKGTTRHDQDRHLSKTEDPFFSQVGSAKEEGDMLVFPTHIPLTKRAKLYIRSAYKVIYDAAVTRVDATMPKYSLVTGTPGIGKSAFLYYAFWRKVKAKQRVFFVQEMIYFDGENMLDLSEMPRRRDLQFWTPDLWCLVDSVDPTSAGLSHDRCSILLATSPRRDIVKEFKKLVPEPVAYYMPTWSDAELNSIAGLHSSPNWKDRFEALGGIPRYVLEQVSQSPEQLLSYACSTCDLNDTIRMIAIDSEVTSKTKVVQTLIHFHSKAPYTTFEVGYASKAALEKIVLVHKTTCIQQMKQLLEAALPTPQARALCGYIFEMHALKLLQKGGEFECRELGEEKKPCEIRTIPKSPNPAQSVKKVEENQEVYQLHIPKATNYASIDAWMPGFGAFQITVATTHDIKDGVTDDLAKLGAESDILYWCIPPTNFDSFTAKRPKKFKGLKQWAILIPYPDVLDETQW